MTEEEFWNLHHKRLYVPDHLYCDSQGKVYEYRLEMEKTIGRYLTPKEQVHHHYNKDGSTTLVLCPNQQYHSLLHLRKEALRMCDNADWRKCKYCKQYDNLENMSNGYSGIYHKECATAYMRERCQRR
jgi:hypothetical protein